VAADLRCPDPPPAKALSAAQALLVALGALDDDHRITDTGRRMLAMPVHPRLAHMIVTDGSALSCVVAALLEERDVFRGRPDDLPADLTLRVAAVCGTPDDRADRGAVQRARALAADIARRASLPFDLSGVDPDRTGAAVLLAFPDRLAGRRRPGQFQLRTGNGAWLPPTDPLANEPFLVAADLDGKRDRARIRLAAAVDTDDVARNASGELDETATLRWDDERDDLVATVERRLGSLRLGQHVRPATPSEETTDALLRRVRETRLAVLGWSAAAAALRRRVDFLHRQLGEPWPDWSVDHLTATLDVWLRPFLVGATSRTDLERLDMTTVLRSLLPWPLGADVDEHAPATLELPTGRSVPIEYDDVASAHVRVQDLFGLDVHPTAAGRPVVLHLLSPADRPLQITSDLPGFWRGSWADVRKEMAGRYPKHSWPDDPTTAQPRRLRDR
ncbi:MAG TPA: ATP-dependent helicase C-terminal domain-containing protein, partial [Ilumatobacteraceae bacterium]